MSRMRVKSEDGEDPFIRATACNVSSGLGRFGGGGVEEG